MKSTTGTAAAPPSAPAVPETRRLTGAALAMIAGIAFAIQSRINGELGARMHDTGVLLLGLATVAGQLIGALPLDLIAPTGSAHVSASTIAGTALTLLAVAIAARPGRRRLDRGAKRRGKAAPLQARTPAPAEAGADISRQPLSEE